MMYYTHMESPVGKLLLAGDVGALKLIEFQTGMEARTPKSQWMPADTQFREVIRQLNEYFERKRRVFDLPLAPEGTPFQQAVWRSLQEIPYGATLSYGELARTIGRANSARAVGAANGQNPLPIVIPCHRVIGSNGQLTGYGGGVHIKRALLALEQGLTPLWARGWLDGDRNRPM